VDRRNRAQTLVAQAERRLRDTALELGPYGAERQQRSVELALREVQDLLQEGDSSGLELAASQLQEALFGLNRRLMNERRAESGPLQGLKNTLGSLKDELFAEDDWDDWGDRGDRGSRADAGRGDPWASPMRSTAAVDRWDPAGDGGGRWPARNGSDRRETSDGFDRGRFASARYEPDRPPPPRYEPPTYQTPRDQEARHEAAGRDPTRPVSEQGSRSPGRRPERDPAWRAPAEPDDPWADG
jgi:molecular chaperone DnaK